jgi:hypothetical protein
MAAAPAGPVSTFELGVYRDTFGPPRSKNPAMFDLIDQVIAVVEAHNAAVAASATSSDSAVVEIPAVLWDKIAAANDTLIDLGDTGAAPGDRIDATTELSSFVTDAQVAADRTA